MSRDLAADAEEAKTQGNAALEAKDFDKAIQHYTVAIDLSKRIPPPNNRHVYFSNRSAAYLSKGFAKSALTDAEECIKCKPDWPKGYSRKAAALHADKKYDEAEKVYQEGLTLFPNDTGLQTGLQTLHEAREAARSGYRSGPSSNHDDENGANPEAGLGAIFNDPDAMERLRSDPRTKSFMQDQRFVQTLELMKSNPSLLGQLIQMDPRIQTAIAVMLNLDFDVDAMSKQRDEAQKRAEKEAEVQKELEKKRKEEEERLKREAETPEERTAREAKERAEIHKERGNALYKQKKFDEALEEYALAIKECPTNMLFELNRASALMEKGDLNSALEACENAITIGRSNHASYENIAKAFERRGNAYAKFEKWNEALAEYRKAQLEFRTSGVDDRINKIERQIKAEVEKAYINPELGKEAKERGNTKFKAGDWAGALNEYNEAIKRDPTNAVYYVNRAAAYTKVLDFGRALEDAEKAIKLDPKYVKAWARKGKIEQFTKKYHRALESFKEGLKLDENDVECQEGLKTVASLITAHAQDEDGETRAKRAMEDPEIRGIMSDPVMMQVLRDMKEDPKSANKHLTNPAIRGKIEKLIAAGILKMG
jgi:stress-induced-phosphoprotein 1